MNTKLILLLTIALFLIGGMGCEKDTANELPPATQVGANTFGCKINGVVYKCSGPWNPKGFLSSEGVYYQIYGDEITINALTKNPDNNISIKFNCKEKRSGIYKEQIKLYNGRPIEGSDSKVIITRIDNYIISGIFQMDIQFSDGEIWYITEGRFDIKKMNDRIFTHTYFHADLR
ncbi:MAG: hypothetical protein Q4G63_07475 [Bacteroidia bacterium]|nr:hypothetical protein [Bacteroidia bacterium]